MNHYLILFILVIINNFPLKAQNSKITGIIRDKNSQAPVANATIKLQNASSFTITDVKGMFSMEITECRICTFEVIAINYKSQTIYDIDISLKKENYTEIELSEKENFLDEVIIKGENFHKTPETPLSLKSLSASEIERMPGGLRDISRRCRHFQV